MIRKAAVPAVRPVVFVSLCLACPALLLWLSAPFAVAQAGMRRQNKFAIREKMEPWMQGRYRTGPDPSEIIRSLNSPASVALLLEFKGNLTALEPLSNGSYPGLLRQSDCSISLLTAAKAGSYALEGETPNYQDTLHRYAQLTTTPDQFKGGCTDPVLGQMSNFATIVGKTSQGYEIGAIGTLNGNETGINTYVYDAVNQKLVSSASNPTGPNSGDIAVGDLNGDGINDMVVPVQGDSTAQSGSVAVLLGNADGTFQSAVLYPVPFVPYGVVLDDFNGDGKPDIVVSGTVGSGGTHTPALATLLGNGDGTFQPAATTGQDTSATTAAFYMAAADFNGDGKLDIAGSNGTLWLGNGDGTFTVAAHPWTSYAPLASDYLGITAADFNHDGKTDLAVVTWGNQSVATILLGNGDGTFTAKASYPLIYGAVKITTTDLDGDGNLDLVLGSSGEGGFGSDVNTNGALQVLMGNGDGTFQDSAYYPDAAMSQSQGIRSFAVADVNHDGNLDLVGKGQTSSGQDAIAVRFGDGKDDFSPGPVSALQSANEYDLQTADMNGDGNIDVLTLGDTSTSDATPALHVYLGNGDGTFQAGASYSLPSVPWNYAVGDINGDGKPDVIVLSEPPNGFSQAGPGAPGIYELLNNGDGTLAAPKLIDGTVTAASSIAMADLNGDGDMDFVVQQDGNDSSSPPVPGDVVVYLGHGDGTFATGVPYLANTYGGGALAVADINGDGISDIVTDTATDSGGNLVNSVLTVLPGKGDGTFGSPITTPQSDNIPFLTDIAVGDFNGDGKLDVAQGDCCGYSQSWMLFGNGDGTFQAPVALSIGGSSTSLAAAYITGKKYPDLLLATSDSSAYSDIVDLQNLYGANLTATTPVQTTTGLSISPSTAAAGQSVTFTATVTPASGSSGTPTGTVAFMNGTTQLGSASLNGSTATFSTSSLTAGTYSVTAVYSGDSNFSGSTSTASSLTITAVVTPVDTTTTLTASPTTATAGDAVTLTAIVKPSSGSAVPTGTVAFVDGSTNLGSSALDNTGTATLSTSSLAAGSHSITASYSGDSADNASTSSAVTVTINQATPSGFTLALSPSSGSIASGGSATTTATITPSGGFSQSVSFSCSGLPANATCSFSPTAVTPGSAAVTSTMTISTGVQSGALDTRSLAPDSLRPVFAVVLGGGLFWLFIGGRRRSRKDSPLRRISGMLLFLVVLTAGVIGCGGGSGSSHKTPSGTSSITITATGGSVTQTATFMLTVH